MIDIVYYHAGVSGNKEIDSSMKISGEFECIGSEGLSIENFAKINAPAIIFPFIRENLASISMKAGIPTILLPPINFVKLAESNQKELNQSH